MLRKQHLLLFTNCVTHKLLIFQNNSSLYPIKALNTQLSIHIIGLGPMPGYSNRHNCCLDNNQTYLFDKNIMIWSLPGVTLEDAARSLPRHAQVRRDPLRLRLTVCRTDIREEFDAKASAVAPRGRCEQPVVSNYVKTNW